MLGEIIRGLGKFEAWRIEAGALVFAGSEQRLVIWWDGDVHCDGRSLNLRLIERLFLRMLYVYYRYMVNRTTKERRRLDALAKLRSILDD